MTWLRRLWNKLLDRLSASAPEIPWNGPVIIGEHGPEPFPDFADYRIWARPVGSTLNGCTHPIDAVKSMPGQMGTHGATWWKCYLCGEEVTKDRAFRWQAPGTTIRKRGAENILLTAHGHILRVGREPDEIHWRAA